MTTGKEMIRQNINLLEYPLWFQDERMATSAEDGFVWQDIEGYVYRCGYKTPVKTDVIFLLYLLLQSQQANYAQVIRMSRYQILHSCGLRMNSKSYDRLVDSLERWKMVGIKFSGAFYDGKDYQTINFGVIDSWEIDKETQHLKVYFSPKFIEMMLGKGFFRFINFTEFKQLHSPLATRLYEILGKSFHGRDLWEIDAVKLAEKIPMKERYPAHIIPKIRTAIGRINGCTQSSFTLNTRPIERGHTILVFRKTDQVKPAPVVEAVTEKTLIIPEAPEVKALIDLLPEIRRNQKTILEIVLGFYEMRGAPYVERNIRYANKHAKHNYRPYLLKALRADYGLAMQVDEEAKRQVREQEARKATVVATQQIEEQRRRHLEVEAQNRALAYIAGLSPEEKTRLEQEAIAGMDEKIRTIVHRRGPGAKIMLSLSMEKVAIRRLEETKTRHQPNLPTIEEGK